MLRILGLELVRARTMKRLREVENREGKRNLLLWAAQNRGDLDLLGSSTSQLGQDIFALVALRFKTGGFFVEFGATDGRTISNTWLLEKHFGWNSILAEPGQVWRDELKQNRAATVDTRAVWSQSGKWLDFEEEAIPELSHLEASTGAGKRGGLFQRRTRYQVETLSLCDLLELHHAPSRIDYLSIDTEGSERTILESFCFSRFRFSVISVEHNFSTDRGPIRKLLESKGYRQVLTTISGHDDFYIDKELELPEFLPVVS